MKRLMDNINLDNYHHQSGRIGWFASVRAAPLLTTKRQCFSTVQHESALRLQTGAAGDCEAEPPSDPAEGTRADPTGCADN